MVQLREQNDRGLAFVLKVIMGVKEDQNKNGR